MTSPNTLERMARAMAKAYGFVAPDRDWPDMVHLAKAALAELKTVDDSTVEAMAAGVFVEGWQPLSAQEALLLISCFTAAIDHILNQGAEG